MKPANYYKACLKVLNPELPSEWESIAKAYKGRAYHNLNHLEEMLEDNEARSADQAVVFLQKAGVSEADQTCCRQLILATKTHDAATEEEAVLVDLDLAVLARAPTGYDLYAENVRKEFRLFPDFLYRPGRKKALRHFLEKPYIFHGEIARGLWETPARTNLERELNGL